MCRHPHPPPPPLCPPSRSQQISDLPAKELVPGDVVQLHMGDKVPADIRLLALKTAIIRVEQASLTGEAVPVAKQPNVVVPDDIELQVRQGIGWVGVLGRGVGMVAVLDGWGTSRGGCLLMVV